MPSSGRSGSQPRMEGWVKVLGVKRGERRRRRGGGKGGGGGGVDESKGEKDEGIINAISTLCSFVISVIHPRPLRT